MQRSPTDQISLRAGASENPHPRRPPGRAWRRPDRQGPQPQPRPSAHHGPWPAPRRTLQKERELTRERNSDIPNTSASLRNN